MEYCYNSTKDDFQLKLLIDSFRMESGLKRSIDKVYEIIVYSLFSTLIECLNIKIELLIDEKHINLLDEFEDFTKKIMNIDKNNFKHIENAQLYRVGVTNAADQGLDMHSNWGPAIQIKHLSLDEELAESIVTGIMSDKIVIVCKDVDKKVILSLLTQIGWKSRIQSIVTESDLIIWYEKALT